MIFLQPSDLDMLIKADVLTTVTSSQPAILDQAELAAIQEMQSYLRHRYDMAAIFQPAPAAPDPDTRPRLIVMYCIDIALYHIHSRVNPRQIPELRGIRYDAAINWLKAVSKGEITPDLPLLEAETGGNVIAYGSELKRNNRM